MTRPDHIHAIHEPGGEHLFGDRPGWIVFTEAIGADPNDHSGRDYRAWTDRGIGVIVRLNHGYGTAGTLPLPGRYADFAQRVANYMQNSRGCTRYIIGNEPNHSQERPDKQPIRSRMYAECFRLCAEAVRTQGGPSHDLIVAPVAPWNVETGDWVRYWQDVLERAGELAGGLALHTYSHGSDPALVTSDGRMDVPFEDRHYHFRAYRDLLAVVPRSLRHLPVYITETNQDGPWLDANNGWVQEAYAEIDGWNRTPGTQKIHCLALYRWPNYDQWGFEQKPGVHEDFRAAVAKGYRVPSVSAAGIQHNAYLPVVAVSAPPAPERDWDPRLTERGVQIETPDDLQPGQWYWRVIRGRWYNVEEAKRAGPDHHILVDMLDEHGQRTPGQQLVVEWPGERSLITTEAKPGERWAANYPMSPSRNEFSIRPASSPAERVTGIGMGADLGDGFNAAHHTNTEIVWQMTRYQGNTQQRPEESMPQPSQPAPAGIIDPLTALAFLRVESGNQPFMDGLLTIRFEVHRFEAYLGNQALFDRHFKYTPRAYNDQWWRPQPTVEWRHAHGSMAQRHELLRFARSLDDTAALNSTGMGMAQIMGHNAQRVGFGTPQRMFAAFSDARYGVNAQLMGFVNYVLSDGRLAGALRQGDWHTAIQLYNGIGQEAEYTRRLNEALREIRGAVGG